MSFPENETTRLAVFPKAWLPALCDGKSMSLNEWITLSEQFDVDGLEFYAGFHDLQNRARWPEFRKLVEDQGRCIPMMCCSPDFTHPDPAFRRRQIDKERHWIDMTVEFGGQFCRILTGQRRPDVAHDDAMNYAADAIEECRRHAIDCGIDLILENHYKDGFWEYPEFAQYTLDFIALLKRIPEGPGFGVNFDPSNCIICGEDPIRLLELVKNRVLTMHASDRYFSGGSFKDLLKLETNRFTGYASILHHGVIGKGLNDYNQIFRILQQTGFRGWISIEDGDNLETSVDDIHQSALFLRKKILEHGMDTPFRSELAGNANG